PRSGGATALPAIGWKPMALLVLALVALWTWALVSTPRAGASGLQVTQCTSDSSTSTSQCSQTPTTVQTAPSQPRRSAPQVQVIQRPVSSPKPAEEHRYSLSSG